jgi:hypothetical protein
MPIAFYKKVIFISSATSLACILVYFIIDANLSHYQSEYLTTESLYSFEFFMVLINSFVIAVLSLTILLNNYNSVKNNIMLSALAWFVCPMGWIAIIIVKCNSDLFNFSQGLNSPAIFDLINTLPYVVVSVVFFIRFRRALKIELARISD